jgi:hypothetical protein
MTVVIVHGYTVACSQLRESGALSTVCMQHAEVTLGAISSSLSTSILDRDWTMTS